MTEALEDQRPAGTGVQAGAPVTDWATDYDVLDPGYVVHPYDVWAELRTGCPVAHSDRWGGSWMPTRYADVAAVAHDTQRFSSRDVGVVGGGEEVEGFPDIGLPPIDKDPPAHTSARRLILPWFSHDRVASYEAMTRTLCDQLIDRVIDTGTADAAQDYAQRIPVKVISWMLGVPDELADTFTEWVRDVLEHGHEPERSMPAWNAIAAFFLEALEQRRRDPGDDLVSDLLRAEIDGTPVPDDHVLGTLALILVAGVDTTWSSIGSAMWHLATHDDDRRRLVAEPELIPTAIEELLRAYSPVTMARAVVEDTELAGCPLRAGDKVLLSFAAANRDPEAFERADEVVIDRAVNRHVAFGVGIHRCAGSNLARMELQVAVEQWLQRIPEFRLIDGAQVTWAGGQVRGPRRVPVEF
ncbi:MAG: cytochrome P450 [Ilumatobacteraceae bacterium]